MTTKSIIGGDMRQALVSNDGARLMTLANGPDRLLGLGFRHWYAGYQTGNIACWESAWQLYSEALGPKPARVIVDELSNWVRSVSASTRRDIQVCPTNCDKFCQDECLAVSMIAASQHKTCPAMRACAFALVESALIDDVVCHCENLALTLKSADQFLSPASIVIEPFADMAPATEYPQ